MRRQGSRFGRRAPSSSSASAPVDPILAMSPVEDWVIAPAYLNSDYLTVGIQTWTGRANGLVFSQATSAARPAYLASTAALNSAASASIRTTSTQDFMVSTAAAAFWDFLHDGTGMTVLLVGVRRNAALSQRWLTNHVSLTDPGITMSTGASATTARARIGNGASSIVAADPASSMPVDTGVCFSMRYRETEAPSEWVSGTALGSSSGNSTGAPVGTAAASSLCIGAYSSGGAGADVDLARVLIFDRFLSGAEMTTISGVFTSLYGFGV